MHCMCACVVVLPLLFLLLPPAGPPKVRAGQVHLTGAAQMPHLHVERQRHEPRSPGTHPDLGVYHIGRPIDNPTDAVNCQASIATQLAQHGLACPA